MQTFQLTLALACSAVVTKEFLAEARKEAQDKKASVFLKTIQAKFPEDDDQFMLAVVKNAYRSHLRQSLLYFMAGSGVGGNVSPVQITGEKILQPVAAVADFALATDPDAAPAETPTKAVQLRITESPITLPQGPKE